MAQIHVTIEGEMLDLICFRAFSRSSGYMEQVFELNPNLAELGAVLPASVEILLPEAPHAPDIPAVSLWE